MSDTIRILPRATTTEDNATTTTRGRAFEESSEAETPRGMMAKGAYARIPRRSSPAVILKTGELPTSTPADDVIERQRTLTQRLDEVREHNARLGEEERRLEREIASVQEGLRAGRRPLPMAKMLIASPCDVPWSAMKREDRAGDRRRFCGKCQKHVHNLAAMTRVEVEDFLAASAEASGDGSGVCVRLYERKDGTVLTADCPVGLNRRRSRAVLLASLGAGACALFGFSAIALAMTAFVPATPRPPPPAPRIVVEQGPTVYVPQVIERVPAGYTRLPDVAATAGWVFLRAPEGAKIFEGKRLLGTGPLVITMSAGEHTLRAEGVDAATGKKWTDSRSFTVTGGNVGGAGGAAKTDVVFMKPAMHPSPPKPAAEDIAELAGLLQSSNHL